MKHHEFLNKIDQQIDNLRNKPKEESYSRICDISKQLQDYSKKTGIKLI